MNVIIKGMKMPKACEWCRFISGGLEWYCEAGQIQIYDYKTIHKDCPLVAIPTPHGDLIDRDRLIAVLKSTTAISQSDYDLFNHIVGLIEHQPTIIESEQGDG